MLDNLKSSQSHSSAKSRSRAPGHTDCLKSMSRTITMQGLTLAPIIALENAFLARLDVNNARLDVKSQQSHSSAKSGQGHQVITHAEYIKDNARFETGCYHHYREIHLKARLNINC